MSSYTNLYQFRWALGVHHAPTGYQHPWLVVTLSETIGFWTRREARKCWADYRALMARNNELPDSEDAAHDQKLLDDEENRLLDEQNENRE
jgi:D-tyrosyl-tRNA(Tyr) deacylase